MTGPRPTGAARWGHLPGNGRGPVQPAPALRVVVAARRLVKPLVLFGFFGTALYMVATHLPGLVAFGK